MGFGFIIAIPQGQEPEGPAESRWDADKYDQLSSMAAKFKKMGDTVGIHLCAIVEEEMRAVDRGERECRCLGCFYLALAHNRVCDGADHELAHLLLPQIQDLMREAIHMAQMERLKAEVSDCRAE